MKTKTSEIEARTSSALDNLAKASAKEVAARLRRETKMAKAKEAQEAATSADVEWKAAVAEEYAAKMKAWAEEAAACSRVGPSCPIRCPAGRSGGRSEI